MNNAITYSASFVDKTIGRNGFYLGVNESPTLYPTSVTGFYSGYAPASGGYTIYRAKAVEGPSIYSTLDDAETIQLTKTIAFSVNDSTPITTISDALTWLMGNPDCLVVNQNYPKIVTNGLLLYMDASFTPSYYKAGTSWYDLSSSNADGTLINGVSYVSNNGGSLDYDASSAQYVDVPDLGSLSTFTVCAWFKLNTLPTTAGCAAIICNQFDGSVLNFSIGLNQSPGSANICGGFFDGSWRTTTGFAPSTDTWYYVAVTYNGSLIVQYLNGALQTFLSYSGTPTSSGLGNRIGRRWDSPADPDNCIDGEIPVVQIYNRALTSGEILSNYNALKDRY